MPKLWSETLDSHRREIRDAIVDATAGLVEEDGLLSVTMSRIAEATGIGRATLYRYYPHVEAVLRDWHERQVARHLERLEEAREGVGTTMERLAGVLEEYALIAREAGGHRDAELAAFLHRHPNVSGAERRLRDLIRDLLLEGVEDGQVRDDIPPGELTTYILSSLGAAGRVRSKAAIRRLVTVTLAGLRSPR